MTSAIIVAAGKGTRMGPGVDKLFLEIHGCPVVAYTWKTFEDCKCIDELVLVVRDGMQAAFQHLAQRYAFKKPFSLVPGGTERQDSVWNGLQALSSSAEIVAIQDAARPCTSAELIRSTVESARQIGAAVAAQPVVDTIKESHDGNVIERNVDRSRLYSVQTPQTFRVDVIRRAIAEVRERGLLVTDDTAACELIGQPVKLVLNTRPNPKVTRPEDLAYLEVLLQPVPPGRSSDKPTIPAIP